MKIYVVGGATNYANFIQDAELVDSVKDADVVLFTGGEDVTPSLYGCKKHETTYCNINRDRAEKAIFESVKPNQLCLGICRGSQFLCVMNGGLLVQDCEGHAMGRTHSITNGSIAYQITSTHHQMQYPYNLDKDDYDLLFISTHRRSNYYDGEKIHENLIDRYGEPEIVLYHKKGAPKCLAVQGHPEMMSTSPVARMISDLIHKFINK